MRRRDHAACARPPPIGRSCRESITAPGSPTLLDFFEQTLSFQLFSRSAGEFIQKGLHSLIFEIQQR